MSKQCWLVLLHRLKQPLSEGADCLLPRVAEKPKAEIIGEKYRIVAIGKDADAKRSLPARCGKNQKDVCCQSSA